MAFVFRRVSFPENSHARYRIRYNDPKVPETLMLDITVTGMTGFDRQKLNQAVGFLPKPFGDAARRCSRQRTARVRWRV